VLIHLDGLSPGALEEAIGQGHAPTLAGLLARGELHLLRLCSAAPSSTPAFQFALLYGRDGIHGYEWFDRRHGLRRRMDVPDDVVFTETALGEGSPGLLANGGTSYGAIFTGGGLAWASLAAGFAGRPPPPRAMPMRALVALAVGARFAARLPREATLGAADFVRFCLSHRTTRYEWNFLVMRCVLTFIEEMASIGAAFDVLGGAPVIYPTFVAYDEFAHRRGPRSDQALRRLRWIDARLRTIVHAVQAAPEHGYEIYVLSDHGQAEAMPFRAVEGMSFAGFVHAASLPAPAPPGGLELLEQIITQRGRLARLRKWPAQARRPIERLAHARLRRDEYRAARWLGFDPELRVVVGGSIAHIYAGQARSPLERLCARHPRLLEHLVGSPGVGLLAARDEQGRRRLLWRGRGIDFDGPLGQLPPARELGEHRLRRLVEQTAFGASSGDLVVYGAFARAGNVSFAYEQGSHGGIAPDELSLILVHPPGVHLPLGEVVVAAELHRFFRQRYAA
jgi:hypothetical protein